MPDELKSSVNEIVVKKERKKGVKLLASEKSKVISETVKVQMKQKKRERSVELIEVKNVKPLKISNDKEKTKEKSKENSNNFGYLEILKRSISVAKSQEDDENKEEM